MPQCGDGKLSSELFFCYRLTGQRAARGRHQSHDRLGPPLPNSGMQNTDTHRVLKLALSPQGYSWDFVPEEGKDFHDSGAGIRHDRAPQQACADASH